MIIIMVNNFTGVFKKEYYYLCLIHVSIYGRYLCRDVFCDSFSFNNYASHTFNQADVFLLTYDYNIY